MGTSCRIGVLVNGRVKSIYIRYDGRLSGVGEHLMNEINTIGKIAKLILNGNRYSLFEDEEKEENEENKYIEETDAEFISRGLRESCEYFYLFNGRWLVYHNDYEFLFESKKTNARTYLFTPLDDALKTLDN